MSTFAEMHASEDPAEADKIMHSQLEGDNGLDLMAADTPNSMDFSPGNTMSVSLSGDEDGPLRGYWEKLSAERHGHGAAGEGAVGRQLRHVHRRVRRRLAGQHRRRRTPSGSPTRRGARTGQDSRRATSAAAATTCGPSRSASRSPSDTIPTDASRPSTPSTGAAMPRAPGWISPTVSTYGVPRGDRPSRIALPGGPLLQRVTRADAVGDVVVGPARLDDGDGERLAPVGHGEVRGAADLLGQRAQHRARELAQHRLQAAGQRQHAQPDVQPAAAVAARETVLLEGRHQPVDHGAVDADLGRERGDRHPAGALREGPQHPEAAVQRL